jgi:hypothetical protein
VLPAELAELIALQPIGIVLFIFIGRIIPLFAERTGHINDFTHHNSPTAWHTPAASLITPKFP